MSDRANSPQAGLAGLPGLRASRVHGPLRVIAVRERAIAVIFIVSVAFIARAAALFTASIDADEGVYLVMAQQWARGGLPYVTVWDQHPPGLPALLAAVLQWVPDPVLGAHIAALIAVAATALVIYGFCLRHAGNAAAGLIAALLYIICISRWAGLSANTEIFNNLLVSFAAYHLLEAAHRPPGLVRAVLSACVLGVGLQIKYVVLPEAVLLCLGYLAISYRRHSSPVRSAVAAGLMMVAGVLPTVIVVMYFCWQNALQPFLDANIGANLTYIGLIPSSIDIIRDTAGGLLPVIGPVLVLCYGLYRLAGRSGHRLSVSSVQVWVGLWLVAAALDVFLPMKFFRHYFFALYPPICVGAALALVGLAAGRRRVLVIGVLALVSTAVPAWIMGVVRAAPWQGEDVPRLIAETVRAAGAGDEDLYVYRYQPTVYALAGLRPPTPYVMTLELSEFSESAHVDGVREVERIMAAKPRFIVKPEGRLGGPAAPVDDILTRSLTQYRLVRTFEDKADRSLIGLYER